VYTLLFSLLSLSFIPLYLELYSLSFLYIPYTEVFRGADVGGLSRFPLPIAVFTITLFFALTSLFPRRKLALVFPFFSLIRSFPYLSLITIIFLSSFTNLITFVKALQLFLPFIALPFIPLIHTTRRLQILFFKILAVVSSSFSLIHLFSYFGLDASSFDHPVRYSALLDYSIYSSLVSWSSLNGLYLVVLFSAFLCQLLPLPYFAFSGSACLLEITLSYRRDPLLVIIIFGLYLLFCFLTSTLKSSVIYKSILYALIFIVILLPLSFLYSDAFTYSLSRLFDTGSRSEIWSFYLSSMLSDPFYILFGHFKPFNNLHSYPVSLFYSYGLSIFIALFLLLRSSLLRVSRFLKYPPLIAFSPSLSFNIIPAIMISILFSNLVNVSLTQPFYLVNAYIWLSFLTAQPSAAPVSPCPQKA